MFALLGEGSQWVSSLEQLWNSTGLVGIATLGFWKNIIMMAIACVLMYLAIVKKFEPMLLLPIAFGMFIINIPGAYAVLYGTKGYVITDAAGVVVASGTKDSLLAAFEWLSSADFASTDALKSVFDLHYVNVSVAADVIVGNKGLLYYLYKGVDWVIFPPLVFLGIGCMTDFGPLIAHPKSMIIGAAAQLGIFLTFLGAITLLGFNAKEAGAIAIIGGADGPTAI